MLKALAGGGLTYLKIGLHGVLNKAESNFLKLMIEYIIKIGTEYKNDSACLSSPDRVG